jgi:hypothetical protein
VVDEGDAPVIHGPEDIRKLTAKFSEKGAHFSVIRGSDGFITAAAGAKVAIFSRWVIRVSGQKPDGSPMYRFQAQFRWINEPLMKLVQSGTLKGRVIIQGIFRDARTNKQVPQNVDILGWSEWRMEGGILTLEDIYKETEGAKFRPLDDTRGNS